MQKDLRSKRTKVHISNTQVKQVRAHSSRPTSRSPSGEHRLGRNLGLTSTRPPSTALRCKRTRSKIQTRVHPSPALADQLGHRVRPRSYIWRPKSSPVDGNTPADKHHNYSGLNPRRTFCRSGATAHLEQHRCLEAITFSWHQPHPYTSLRLKSNKC